MKIQNIDKGSIFPLVFVGVVCYILLLATAINDPEVMTPFGHVITFHVGEHQ